MKKNKLTELEVKKASPKEKLYRLGDGDGLYLEINPAGGRKILVFNIDEPEFSAEHSVVLECP